MINYTIKCQFMVIISTLPNNKKKCKKSCHEIAIFLEWGSFASSPMVLSLFLYFPLLSQLQYSSLIHSLFICTMLKVCFSGNSINNTANNSITVCLQSPSWFWSLLPLYRHHYYEVYYIQSLKSFLIAHHLPCDYTIKYISFHCFMNSRSSALE